MGIHLQVVRGRGAPQSLRMQASSVDEARRQAQAQGYTVLDARVPALDWRQLIAAPSARPARVDVLVFVEQLHDLLRAGLSVVEALSTLRRAADRQGALSEVLLVRLRGGERLSDALAADARFAPLLVALVRASELTSDLPQALARYLEHEKRVTELRHRIVSVVVYPLLVTGVGAAVLCFLLFYVIPRFARIFEGMTGDLPWSAHAMVWWARWLHDNGAWLAIGGVAAGAAAALVASSPEARGRAQRGLMQWGPLRDRFRSYLLARWYRTTGMLVTGGIPLPQALALANGLLPPAMRAAGVAAERGLRDGLAPAEAHARAGMATAVSEQLMRAGERTGDMGTVLTHIAEFHESETTRALERGMRLLEPLVMALIGVGVGAIVVLMYMPIFELADAIQ